jgi:hypothetical protein
MTITYDVFSGVGICAFWNEYDYTLLLEPQESPSACLMLVPSFIYGEL